MRISEIAVNSSSKERCGESELSRQPLNAIPSITLTALPTVLQDSGASARLDIDLARQARLDYLQLKPDFMSRLLQWSVLPSVLRSTSALSSVREYDPVSIKAVSNERRAGNHIQS